MFQWLFGPDKKQILKREIAALTSELKTMAFAYELKIPLVSLLENDNDKFLDWAIEQNRLITEKQDLLLEKMKDLQKYEKN